MVSAREDHIAAVGPGGQRSNLRCRRNWDFEGETDVTSGPVAVAIVGGLGGGASSTGGSISSLLRSSRTRSMAGLVEENGLLVYRTCKPLPVQVVDEAIHRSREDGPGICSALSMPATTAVL